MKNIALLYIISLVFCPSLCAGELPFLWLEAGKEIEFGGVDGTGTLTNRDWVLRFEHRVLNSGKTTSPLGRATQVPTFAIPKIKTPPLKPGITMRAKLFIDGKPYRDVVIASPDPFTDKKAWCAAHPIALYDPEKKTAATFEQEEIPFIPLKSFADIEAVENAVIIVGCQNDFEREKGLAEILFAKAAQGASVLVGAPKGNVPLDFPPSIESLSFDTNVRRIFPWASERHGGANWMLQAQNDRLVLVPDFIRPYGMDGTSKIMGIGPTLLDIRFADPASLNRPIKPLGRIILDKELYFRIDIESKYYFKSLIETLTKEKP